MGKVLVTGGAGFIGSHLVDLLIAEGTEVVIVDNLSSGSLKHVHPSSHLFKLDILDERVADVFQEHPDIDRIVHLAAQSKVGPSVLNPTYDAQVNIQGTIRLLEFSRKYGVKQFVFASSAAIYGPSHTLPIREEFPALPLSPYGTSKYAAEAYVKTYGRLYGLNVHVLRFANVYGPRQTAETEAGVISIFIEKLLKNEQPIIFGDGKQTRDFIFVLDVVNAIRSCLETETNQEVDPVYNVSTGLQTSVEDLLKELCAQLNVTYAPAFEQERSGDIKHSCLDQQKLMNHVLWEPNVMLHKGLAETIEYYKSKKNV
ncbi:GDP-mannose 4,6-dehydratase [Halalkalibacterium halodurans]|uniref:NAD-dependent epimerase/dehydratase family protein n=1 Tax=Halalkalibacterium halodurans TaxID=86665 RepID=UPI002E222E1A|nr:NAD-dependent epimerase/dehydratase family protein [Halalkalibacterium halodurans]MED3645248.1 GDP-mannose 4,6-dehydratase [Halalkalibacterium halodurans]MED4164829.1 GDP-mannose 4,6-dehydratase [Halalkalibacterium halodurans]